MEYNFTLTYKLPVDAEDIQLLIERIGEQGCTDAIIGIGTTGRIALEFDREAASADDAILSAMKALKTAMPAAELIEVAPDYVGITDAAEKLGISRQGMRKIITKAPDFPAPVHENVYHLVDILAFMTEREKREIARALFDVSHVARKINFAKDQRSINKVIAKDHLDQHLDQITAFI